MRMSDTLNIPINSYLFHTRVCICKHEGATQSTPIQTPMCTNDGKKKDFYTPTLKPHPYNLLIPTPKTETTKIEKYKKNYREGNQSLQAKYLFLETHKVRDQIHLEESLSSYTCEKYIFKKIHQKKNKSSF
jgi:hypothetical protein